VVDSEVQNGSYFAVNVKSRAFKDLERPCNEFLKIKGDFERKRFIFPLNEHLDLFKNSKDSSTIIRFDNYSFVRVEEAKDSITPMEEFYNLYKMFDGDRHYMILNNDCTLMNNIKRHYDLSTMIINEGETTFCI
jgi:hypothetical protein